MSLFNAIYFDGKSSRGNVAYVELLQDGIHITYTDADADKTLVVWDVAQIHKGAISNTRKINLKYGPYPHQYLEVEDPTFYEALISAYPYKKFNESDFEFLRSNGFKGLVAITFGFIAVVLLSYFFVLPPVAEFMAARMPQSMEEQIGDKMYNQMVEGYSINQPLTKKANEFWRAMNVESPYTVNITVVSEETPNAFALPGGQIVVFDGIIKEMKSYDEMAALLGHECTHVRLKHTMRSMSRNLAGYLFISILLNDASGTIALLASNANTLKELSFTRELEHQADEGGYSLLRSKQIDPEGMLRLFSTLKKAEGDMTIPRFMSTHPLTDERIDYIKSQLKRDKATYAEHADLKQIWDEMKAED
jgi:Zn-dependent protease with chaperone function